MSPRQGCYALGGALFCLGILSGCASVPSRPVQGRYSGVAGEGKVTADCTLGELARAPLVVEGGRQLYVEPAAFVANLRGDVLLAGTPNMLTSMTPEGKITAAEADTVFGAVIRHKGGAHTIPAPIQGRLMSGIRAVARRDGRWAVVFAEVKPYAGDSRPDTAVALWYGVYDGARWSEMEKLPLPAEGTLHPMLASSLVQRGDTLAWAMTMSASGGRRHIALFERRGGRWSYEIVPTFHARVELAYSDTLGLTMAVVQPDTTFDSDGNSLLLWTRQTQWRKLRRLVHGSVEGPVYVPSLTFSPAGSTLSWHSTVQDGPNRFRDEARLLTGHLEEGKGTVAVLDSSAVIRQYPFAPVLFGQGRRLWVMEHLLPGSRESEIRLVRDSAGIPVLLRRIPNPYVGGKLAAVAPTSSELLVTGLHYIPGRYIVSLLLRARFECHGTTS